MPAPHEARAVPRRALVLQLLAGRLEGDPPVQGQIMPQRLQAAVGVHPQHLLRKALTTMYTRSVDQISGKVEPVSCESSKR